ncbi:MAG: dihydrofolate reductase [Alphaproteobacteria bacterium]
MVAAARNGVIGREGRLPWRIPEDMRWFRKHTMGKTVVMGRKTWRACPRPRCPAAPTSSSPATRSWEPFDEAAFSKNQSEGHRLLVTWGLDAAIEHARGDAPAPRIVVIGGAELAAALPLAGRLYLTEVDLEPEGDAFMPPFRPQRVDRRLRADLPGAARHDPRLHIRVLERGT